mmetsp:Transcript_32042/g.47138  ORF Transcript_32042/g.47138 Transcript_32042/m.47138 type:complete len:113 (-) Transcript_32042:75-413(-)
MTTRTGCLPPSKSGTRRTVRVQSSRKTVFTPTNTASLSLRSRCTKSKDVGDVKRSGGATKSDTDHWVGLESKAILSVTPLTLTDSSSVGELLETSSSSSPEEEENKFVFVLE